MRQRKGRWRFVWCQHTYGPEHIIFRTRTTVLAIRTCSKCLRMNLHLFDPSPMRGMKQRRMKHRLS